MSMHMNSAKTITQDSLMTLEAYAKIRKSAKADVIKHRRLRTVHRAVSARRPARRALEGPDQG